MIDPTKNYITVLETEVKKVLIGNDKLRSVQHYKLRCSCGEPGCRGEYWTKNSGYKNGDRITTMCRAGRNAYNRQRKRYPNRKARKPSKNEPIKNSVLENSANDILRMKW